VVARNLIEKPPTGISLLHGARIDPGGAAVTRGDVRQYEP
jgi:hypothetical protein